MDALLGRFLCVPIPEAPVAEVEGGEDGGSVVDERLLASRAGGDGGGTL